MLRSLQIRNLAIIDALELEFHGGFGVLTGETGAGKSILIDALGLVIGGRADRTLVRSGAERAEVSAEFTLDDAPAARRWLEAHEIDAADGCLVRRVLQADGRTRAFVNGSAVPAGELASLGETLVEIFGQGESQRLLRAEAQREALDQFGGHVEELAAVREAAATCAAVDAEVAQLRAAQGRDPAQAEFLRFQLGELDALKLEEGESTALDAEHRRLTHAGRLIEEGAAAQSGLYGGDSNVYDQLNAVLQLLRGLVPLHAGFEGAETLAGSAQAQVREAADAIRRELDHLELDPMRLAEVEARLGSLHTLARKHRVRADELPVHHARLRAEVEALEGGVERLKELEHRQAAALGAYRKSAAALGTARTRAAKKLAEAATTGVRPLGLPNARLEIVVEADPQAAPSPLGTDQVRFDFSANPGQPPRPLAKVASGGELSRVSLALQVALQQAIRSSGTAAATMVFDEVDAGIGGGVAEIVGQQLRALGAQRQVMCVTHLAQVAAQGDAHFGIRKEVVKGETYTRVDALEGEKRTAEIARMLGGTDLTAATRRLAKELLERAAH